MLSYYTSYIFVKFLIVAIISSATLCFQLLQRFSIYILFPIFILLQPDYYRDAAHFRLVGEGPQYRLEIPYAKLDFTGTYSVIARNCHGEAKAVISLQIYAKGNVQHSKEAWTICLDERIIHVSCFQVKAKRRK